MVAAKAFNLLQATVDYFDCRADEEERIAKTAAEQRQPPWSELADKMAHTREMRQQIDSWHSRPKRSGDQIASSEAPYALDVDSPEATAAAYLTAIASRNFGNIAKLTIDYPLRSIGYRAGWHRDQLGDLRVTRWEITGLSDEAPGISDVIVKLEGTYDERQFSGEQMIRLIWNDEKYNIMARGTSGGRWSVMQNFLPTSGRQPFD